MTLLSLFQSFHGDHDDEFVAGHLVEYPIRVDEEGNVFAMDDSTNFPDTEAAIEGAKSAHLPNKLTT